MANVIEPVADLKTLAETRTAITKLRTDGIVKTQEVADAAAAMLADGIVPTRVEAVAGGGICLVNGAPAGMSVYVDASGNQILRVYAG